MDALHTLLEQAESQRNIALAAFSGARARRDDARTQTRELEAYRDDYTARWNGQFQRGAALEVVRSYHQFASRLELAIAQQAQALVVCDQALMRANDVLTAHELRVASVRKLIERRRHEAQATQAQREQRASDDLRLPAVRNPFSEAQAATPL
jgi:flagellar protein FliJ